MLKFWQAGGKAAGRKPSATGGSLADQGVRPTGEPENLGSSARRFQTLVIQVWRLRLQPASVS
jgi:hypothetical protein